MNDLSNQAVVGTSPRCGSTPHTADVGMSKHEQQDDTSHRNMDSHRDGGDITNVTLCGANAVVDSQSATQIVVIAGAGGPGLGDVRVYSVSFGATVKSNAFTYTTTDVTLTIESPYGIGAPLAGVYTNPLGMMLTNSMSASETHDTTRYICTGWTMAGNEPAIGTTNLCVVTLTNDATLTWLWTTNYWLETGAGLHGSVNVDAGWQASGATTSITAVADQYFHFTNWSGDISLSDISSNPLSLLVDSPKSVTASFAENMAANETPEWWLASYGWTNDFDTAALSDQDSDLMPSWKEYRSDTTPTNEDSCLRLIVIQTEGGSRVQWAGGTGVTQYLEWKTDLADSESWATLFTNAAPTPITNEWPVATTDDKAYFRIRTGR